MKNLVIPLLMAALVAAMPVGATTKRSTTAKRHFALAHPCPSTGKPVMSCRGYVIDHVLPLCAGGPDTPANMQWQTITAAAAKDKREDKFCACLRAKRPGCVFTP